MSRIILGIDIALKGFGYSIVAVDDNQITNVLKLSYVEIGKRNKLSLFERKEIFEKDFIRSLSEYNIDDVIVEEPSLFNKPNEQIVNIVRFSGMISDVIYNLWGITPKYITSLEARQIAFPELIAPKQYDKKGKIKEKNQKTILFGAYPVDIDKKQIVFDIIRKKYPYIKWQYNDNYELSKENFNSCDSLIAIIGYIKKK